MNDYITLIVENKDIVEKIQEKLPFLFQLAEIDNSRDGKIGMEIGSARERIIIALFIYVFGEKKVNTDLPITEKEVDVIVLDKPISIKSITGKRLTGIKIIWTVDPEKAAHFRKHYSPSSDIVLAQINWNDTGYLFFIPQKVQDEVLNRITRNIYIKLPKPGTNPRGVELSKIALEKLVSHPLTRRIKIYWKREKVEYNSYKRWVEHWQEAKPDVR